MNNHLKNVIIGYMIFLIIPFIDFPLFAQTNFALTYYLVRDDNAFRNRNIYDEWINTVSVYLGQNFSKTSSNFNIYYNGDLSTFTNNQDRQNNSHMIGFAPSWMFDNNKVVNFGAYARVRRNHSQYMYYNLDTYNFYGNFRYEPALTKNFTMGFALTRNNFLDFSEINNTEYRLYTRYQQFFEHRISLTGDINLGSKDYVNQKKLNFFGFLPGRMLFPRTTEEPIRATLVSGSLNLGKSLTDKTGMNVSAGGQWYISKPIQALTDQTYYYTENDLYDDPYAYENQSVSLNFTRQFAVGFQGKIGAEYQNKNYRGTPAFTINGDDSGKFRKDNRTDYYMLVTKTFQTGWRFPGTVEGFCRFLIRSNGSNDPYYHYKDHLGIIGITIGK